LKLEAALEAFGVSVRQQSCADLGCSTGGFTDCLLQRGAARVYAVDTAYGALDWKLRNDERVVVLERRNALHLPPPAPVHLVTVDMGWTCQRHAVAAALAWLEPGGQILTLIKPHYEARQPHLDDREAEAVTARVLESLPALGVTVLGQIESPLRGGKAGSREWLAWLEPSARHR
jgi:23S rRNA (cytidine1920-2'-O)/16S rRNA (cytidine1409-2'-O)-methyltransferase